MARNSNKDSFNYEQEKRQFVDGLRNFHYNRCSPFERTPRLGKEEVDLYQLYQKVTSLGGWKKVTENQRWDEVVAEFTFPKACLNADLALKLIYVRYLNVYEQINFLGEDPKVTDVRRDDEGPHRKKLCVPQFNFPVSYNQGQHEIAENLRGGYGLSTTYARISDYDKLEKALQSGLPNEVDFVINVCTLLSNESKHTLRLDKSVILTDLLLAHIGVFAEGCASMERVYENGWKPHSTRDFIKFWYDTIHDDDTRKLISHTREVNRRELVGSGILHLGRNQGVQDKEGIRITQVAIIIRNLSFDQDNMKFLANNDLVFRFLLLCIHCNYGTLRQLALDTMGNLAEQFVLDPVQSFKSQTILTLLSQCITSTDKFAVVRGLEMVAKLSRLEDNEYVLSEKLDTAIYEEIARYLTIHDIQLIVAGLEALYQLSEIGEETNTKIAEVSNTVDTLVSLITVEAQSYGPNSLVGIKVVEYCPPSQVTAGVPDGAHSGAGPPSQQSTPAGQQTTPAQSQPPGPQQPTSSLEKKSASNTTADNTSPMETTTCNWLTATYEVNTQGGSVSHVSLYSEYLKFCKRFQLTQAVPSQTFSKLIKVVFPKVKTVINITKEGRKELCLHGISMRAQQLPFSISCPISQAPPRNSVAPSLLASSAMQQSPTLRQHLSAPRRPIAPNPRLYPTGPPASSTASVGTGTGTQAMAQPAQPPRPITASTTVSTMPTYSISGGISAQGYANDMPTPKIITPASINSTTPAKPKVPATKKKSSKKNPTILPKPEQTSGSLTNIVPKVSQQQPPVLQNVQYTTYPQEIVYQTVDPQNAEQKVMVKTLLAQKIRQGNIVIQQPLQGVVSVDPTAADTSQPAVQYQTSYPQAAPPQTTYIQYAVSSSTTPAVQTFIQQNQSSQVQTFVMPSGEVFVQNQQPVSSLGSQPVVVAQQQTIVPQQPNVITAQTYVPPTQNMITQPQTIVPQQPTIIPQQNIIAPQQTIIPQQQIVPQQLVAQTPAGLPQPQVIPQSQVIAAPPVVAPSQTLPDPQLLTQQVMAQSAVPPTQIIPQPQVIAQPHILPQTQVISQPVVMTQQQQLINSQTTAVMSSGVSPAVSLSTSTASFPSSSDPQIKVANTMDTNTNCNIVSHPSQGIVDSSGLVSSTDIKQTVNSTVQATESSVQCSAPEAAIQQTKTMTESASVNESDKPSMGVNTGINKVGLSSNEAEIESAVGSIMDDNADSQEEPVMIENDGNELMFEQKYQAPAAPQMTEVYMQDEAAAAVGQLEQMEQTTADAEAVLTIDEGNTSAMNIDDQVDQTPSGLVGLENDNTMDSVDMQTDPVLSEGICNDPDLMNEISEEKDGEDKEMLDRFRAETPIIVPIVSENGLYEQDFEARMAVENLLKDVEFTVNGDDNSSEENINMFSCQQQNPGSVQTVSSLGESEIPLCEDSRDSVCSESQTITKTTVVNGTTCVTAKPLPNSAHVPHNGINSEGKPLLNGNISSPEYQSVPSPLVNGGDSTKLVNGIGEEKSVVKTVDKITKMNGVVNHKLEKVLDVSGNNVKCENPQDILAQSLLDSQIDKGTDDKNVADILAQSIMDSKVVDSSDKKLAAGKPDGDILARSILENDIQPSDCDIPDPEPTSVTAVVKQIIPNTVYGNIMTVQINNNTIPITFTTNAIITSKNSLPNQINVCNSRHIPTPESSARDGELSCDSSTSSITTSDLNIVISDKHSSVVSQSKMSHKDSSKTMTSPKVATESKKSKSKKRSRSKSGGSAGADSRSTSPAAAIAAPAPPPPPELQCEWGDCKRCFTTARSVFNHICAVHLKTEYDGLCKWEGCESLVRKRWSLFTHVQDHHCSDTSLRVAAQRRQQSLQTGQTIAAPAIPAMVYPKDAASQAIKRFQPKPPYPEFQEGREGPVTKHIRLTSALILRNLARYSPSGRSLLKKHERSISFVCMSAVESSTALANCLYEILHS